MQIHIVYVINAGRKTDELRRQELAVENIKHRNQFQYFEDFVEFQKNWGEYTYYGNAIEIGYYTDLQMAKKAVEDNAADINEAGAYPYAAILSIKSEQMYPHVQAEDEDVYVYKYNREDDRYEEMQGEEKFVQFLKHKVRGVFTPEDIEA